MEYCNGLESSIIKSLIISEPYLKTIYLDKANPELYVDSFPIPFLPNVFISLKESKFLFMALSLKIMSL